VLFDAPRALIRADAGHEVAGALAAADRARAAGFWIAGVASYELGYAIEPRLAPLMPEGRRVPLLHLGVYDAPAALALPASTSPGTFGPATPVWDAATHATATRTILDLIAAGDIYQANLTFPMRARWSGDPRGVHAGLTARQPVPYGAFVALAGAPVVISMSPELFFATDAEGRIETRPMKGTAPRDPDPARDAARRVALMQSVKDRAENLMIVDLLRNDMSRVCAVGSVRVPRLYAVETYATLHQMVSVIEGQLKPRTGFADLIGALFPCGSITGAPKIRAMEIIRATEAGPRGAYCGAVGWMAPDGSSCFNVAIRTLTLWPGGEAEFGVGGGIVIDSTPEGEYEEALWKARFARPEPA
jgi:para-aminobenzoate synthetase component 1